MFPTTFPSGQGSDLAGVVVEVGTGVDGFAVGDEVFGWTEQRASHAEYVVAPGGQLTHKPAGVPWEVAGSLYVAGATAWASLQAVGAGAGDTVAVSGATGGVGSIVVQLLRDRGATVLGIASEANAEWLRSLGVEPVAYGDGLADRLRAAAPDGIDAFIDTFGGGYIALAVDLGVARDRINTIIDFDAAQQFGAQVKGGGEVGSPEVLAELAGRHGRPVVRADRRDLPAGPGPGRLRRAGATAHPGQDRPAAVAEHRSGGLGHAPGVTTGIAGGRLDRCGGQRRRCVREQLAGVVGHWLAGIHLGYGHWFDHAPSQPVRSLGVNAGRSAAPPTVAS